MKHIRYFDALARHRHFGRAAEVCTISQPALSLQIKELEAMVESQLVERTARQIRLTPLGEDFAVRARDILRAVEELGDLARAAKDTLNGPLRFGIIPTLAPYILPDIIKMLTTDHAALDLFPREAITNALIDEVLASSLDFAIVALPIGHTSLQEMPLFKEDFVLIRPRSHAGIPTPNPAELRDLQTLLLEEGHCFRNQALSYCQTGPAGPRNAIEGNSLSTLVQMVGAGLGVTLVPETAIPLETRLADVDVARFDTPSPSRTVGMVWRKSNPMSDELCKLGASLSALGAIKLDHARA